MPTINASFPRDNNRVPITTDGITFSTTHIFNDTNNTFNNPLFHVIGAVEIRGLWGVVTTAIGVNHTAAYFRLNDQTAQVAITAAVGITLSGLAVGTTITKKGVAATALTLLDNAAGRVSEPTTLETTYFSPFVVMKKTGATTDIEYTYSTTDSPTTGAIQFFCRFLPLSADGTLQII
jgi:hypothetical protein